MYHRLDTRAVHIVHCSYGTNYKDKTFQLINILWLLPARWNQNVISKESLDSHHLKPSSSFSSPHQYHSFVFISLFNLCHGAGEFSSCLPYLPCLPHYPAALSWKVPESGSLVTTRWSIAIKLSFGKCGKKKIDGNESTMKRLGLIVEFWVQGPKRYWRKMYIMMARWTIWNLCMGNVDRRCAWGECVFLDVAHSIQCTRV